MIVMQLKPPLTSFEGSTICIEVESLSVYVCIFEIRTVNKYGIGDQT